MRELAGTERKQGLCGVADTDLDKILVSCDQNNNQHPWSCYNQLHINRYTTIFSRHGFVTRTNIGKKRADILLN
mgnify:CR=1 FL=1